MPAPLRSPRRIIPAAGSLNKARTDRLLAPAAPATHSVCVIEDDILLRRSLEGVIRDAGFQVETYVSATDFFTRPPGDPAGCLVLDLRLPGMSGLELHRAMRAAGYSLPVIFMSGAGDVPSAVAAMKDGAADVLSRPFESKELVASIYKALERRQADLDHAAETAELRRRFDRLTDREREVAAHIAEGLSNKEIAAEVGAAEKTVKNHRAALIRKLAVGSVAELVRMLDRIGAGIASQSREASQHPR